MDKAISPLLERARRLDRYALEELHDILFPVIYRYVCFRLQDPQVCQEITSLIFLRYLQALNKQRYLKGQPQAWLLRLASDCINDFHKEQDKTTRSSLLAQIQPGAEKVSQDKPDESARGRGRVAAAIRQLKPRQQHVLALRFTIRGSLEQTAQLMDEPIQRVRGLQWGALQALQRYLETGEIA